MALILCHECSSEMSDKAEQHPSVIGNDYFGESAPPEIPDENDYSDSN